MSKIVQVIRDAAVKNWRLKGLAVAVAVATFYATRSVTRYEVDYEVPVTVEVAEEGIAILNQEPTTVRVWFRGSQEDLLRLTQSDIKAVVGATASSLDGSEIVPLRPRDIEGAPGVSIVKLDASEVQLAFDREVERQVPVARPSVSGTPLIGNAELDFEPDSVVLRGPRRVLKDVKIVTTEPIDVEGRGADFSQRVQIIPPGDGGGVVEIEPPEIKVRVNIVTETVSHKLTNVTVLAVIDRSLGMAVEFDPREVTVYLHGRAELVDDIKPAVVWAFVDCVGVTAPGTKNLPVTVHLPAGLDVNATVEPKAVTVTARRSVAPPPTGNGDVTEPSGGTGPVHPLPVDNIPGGK